MRLLSAPQGKSKRETDIASQELRVQELDSLLMQKRKEISETDALLVRTLSETGLKNYEEEQAWKEKIQGLINEVTALESRRKSALVPLETREKEVETKERVLLEREEQTILKESDFEYTRQLLEDKLDVVSEREQDAEKYAQILNNREFSVQLQEAQVKQRMEALTTILKESYEEILTSQAESARQKAILKGRAVSITEREKNVEMQEAGFANREKAILDKYKTLQRTITEVNLNNDGRFSNSRSK